VHIGGGSWNSSMLTLSDARGNRVEVDAASWQGETN
jgi:hypothetical protein